MRPMAFALVTTAAAAVLLTAAAQDSYENWPLLKPEFESTGGGGIIIGDYRPVIVGDTCVTDFTATEPNGTVHHNTVTFEATPMADGTLCRNGRWRSRDGSQAGTTPLQVFIKDGIARRSPE